jgi:iron complex outermembrane recepter protein
VLYRHLLTDVSSFRRTALLLACGTILSCSGSAIVLAQATATAAPDNGIVPDQGGVTIGDIIVRARKVSERAQDVPVSITTVTADVLAQQNILLGAALDKITPSLKMNALTDGPSSPTIALRGQVTSDSLLSVDQPIGLYRDGVYIARLTGSAGRLLDVERVEVLKGPQGTLYGRNTTGGAIVFYSVQPEVGGPAKGFVTGRYGTKNNREIEAAINVPLGDKAAARFSAGHSDSDGFGVHIRPNGSTTDIDKERTSLFRAILQANPSDNLRINIAGDFADIKSRGMAGRLTNIETVDVTNPGTPDFSVLPGGLSGGAFGVLSSTALETLLAAGVDPFDALGQIDPTSSSFNINLLQQARTDLLTASSRLQNRQTGGTAQSLDGRDFAFADVRAWGAAATLEYDVGDVTLKSISAFRKTKSDTFNDLDGTAFSILQTETLLDQKQFSQEIQATGRSFSDKLTWLLGAFYFRESGSDIALTQNLGAIAVFDPRVASPYNAIGSSVNTSISGFGQATYKFTDSLSFTGGVRYTADRKQMDLINTRSFNFGAATSDLDNCLLPGQGALTAGLLPQSRLIRDAMGVATGGQCVAEFNNKFSDWSYTAGLDFKPTENILLYAKTSRGFRSGGQNFRGRGFGAAYQPYRPETLTDFEIGIKSDWFGKRLRLNVSAYQSNYNDLQRFITFFSQELQATASSVANAGKARIKGLEAEATAIVTDDLKIGGTFGYVDPKYTVFTDQLGIDRRNERFLNILNYSYSLYANWNAPIGNVGRLNTNVDWSWQSSTPYDVLPNSVEPGYGLLGARVALKLDAVPLTIAVSGANLLNKDYFSQPPLENSLGYVFRYSGRPRTVNVELSYQF